MQRITCLSSVLLLWGISSFAMTGLAEPNKSWLQMLDCASHVYVGRGGSIDLNQVDERLFYVRSGGEELYLYTPTYSGVVRMPACESNCFHHIPYQPKAGAPVANGHIYIPAYGGDIRLKLGQPAKSALETLPQGMPRSLEDVELERKNVFSRMRSENYPEDIERLKNVKIVELPSGVDIWPAKPTHDKNVDEIFKNKVFNTFTVEFPKEGEWRVYKDQYFSNLDRCVMAAKSVATKDVVKALEDRRRSAKKFQATRLAIAKLVKMDVKITREMMVPSPNFLNEKPKEVFKALVTLTNRGREAFGYVAGRFGPFHFSNEDVMKYPSEGGGSSQGNVTYDSIEPGETAGYELTFVLGRDVSKSKKAKFQILFGENPPIKSKMLEIRE